MQVEVCVGWQAVVVEVVFICIIILRRNGNNQHMVVVLLGELRCTHAGKRPLL